MPTVVSPDASTARRVGVLAAGMAFVAIGVGLTIRAELGVAPYDVLTTGIHEVAGIPIGLAATLLPLVFLGGGLLLGGRIGIGTALTVLCVGPLLGVVLAVIPEVEPLVPRIGLYLVGFTVITTGVVLVIVPELGAGAVEVLMLAVTDRGFPLAPARTGIEVLCVVVGFAMGGQVGIGTLAFAVLIGPGLRRGLALAGYDDARAATRSDTASPGA